MTALMRIDQVGLPGGVAGKTRSDGLLTGAVVTVTITVPGETNDLQLLWIPDGDTGTPATFLATSGTTWEFTPSPSCPGTYRILAIIDGVEVEVRELRMRTALLRQIVPSLNELADPNANLTNNGVALVLSSEDNENELSLLPGLSGAEPSAVPSPFLNGNYGGWYRWVRDTSVLLEDRAAGLEPQGFQRPDSLQDVATVDSQVAWVGASGNFTVDPFGGTFYDIFIQGRRVRKESQQLVTASGGGEHWFYFDTDADDLLVVNANPALEERAEIMRSKTPVAIVVSRPVEGGNSLTLIVDKRHGLGLAPAAKAALQVGVGGRWSDGILPSGFVLGDGDEDEEAQFQIGDGFAFMGDLLFAVTDATPVADPQALQPILSLTRWLHRENGVGGGAWDRAAGNATFPTNAGGALPAYDNGFVLSGIPDGQFVLATYFAVKSLPSIPGVASFHEGDRIVAIVGQELLVTQAAAEAAADTVLLDMDTVGLPIQDMVPICTVIIQKDGGFANAAGARVVPTSNGSAFIDHRSQAHEAASSSGGGGVVVGSLQSAYDVLGTVVLDISGTNDMHWDSAVPDTTGFGLFGFIGGLSPTAVAVLKAPNAVAAATGIEGGTLALSAGDGSTPTDPNEDGGAAGTVLLGAGIGSGIGGAGSPADATFPGGAGGVGSTISSLAGPGGAGGVASAAQAGGVGGPSGGINLNGNVGGVGGAASATAAAGAGGISTSAQIGGGVGGTGGAGSAGQAAGAGGDASDFILDIDNGGAAGADGGGGGADGGNGANLLVKLADGGPASGAGTDGDAGNFDVLPGIGDIPGAVRLRIGLGLKFYGPGDVFFNHFVQSGNPAGSTLIALPLNQPSTGDVLGVASGGASTQLEWVSAAVAASALEAYMTFAASEHVDLDTAVALRFDNTDAFSVAFWIQLTSGASGLTVMGNFQTTTFVGWEISIDLGKVVFDLIGTGGGSRAQIISTPTINDGMWHDVVCTYNGGNAASGMTIYIDGSPVAVATPNDTLSSSTIPTEDCFIARRQASGGSNNLLGSLSDVGVYAVELTSGQVTAIGDACDRDLRVVGPTGDLVGYWALGFNELPVTAVDLSPNTNNGAVIGAPEIRVGGPCGG